MRSESPAKLEPTRRVRRPRPTALVEPRRAVNDVHSRLNPTVVREVLRPGTLEGLREAIERARQARTPLAVAGARHAMGGQQFGTDMLLLDTARLDRVLDFDAERGLVEVEAGIHWPALVGELLARQRGARRVWTIAQKQTGADRFSLGGSLAANVHGRGLTLRPLVGDVESFTLVDSAGHRRRCSRDRHAELFALALGGYGLFGVVHTVTLRLVPRRKLQRVVELRQADGLMEAFEQRIREGFLYGDFQFSCDASSPDFLQRGVFSCYRPVHYDVPTTEDARALSRRDWERLVHLAHVEKSEAFRLYAGHYLATSGQVYFSDTSQMSTYLDDYHVALDRRLGSGHPASEMIAELYVPRERFEAWLAEARDALRASGAEAIYGTVRLIERDDETVLAWARGRWAAIVLNLHVEHTPEGIGRAAADFRTLIDAAAGQGGSYYLTYHRFATREQLLRCHPRFPEFAARKRHHDPEGRFSSDWFEHQAALLAGRP